MDAKESRNCIDKRDFNLHWTRDVVVMEHIEPVHGLYSMQRGGMKSGILQGI